ncbi:MAG: hypothetical protein HS115_12595 [Spirochaetales bacterium]|nr:hypothetical protein [Spirochaetales bacterium]
MKRWVWASFWGLSACVAPFPAFNPGAFLLLTSGSDSTALAPVPPNTLVHEYRFTGGSLADSGYLATALSNFGAAAVSGKALDASGAYQLSGAEYLSTSSDARLPLGAEPRTLCAWVSLSQLPVGGGLIALAYGDANQTNGQSALGFINNSGTRLVFGNQDNNATIARPVPLNTWTHICATYDGGSAATLYYNGLSVGTVALSQGIPLNTRAGGSLFVGRMQNDYFKGKIDDVRLYNYVLSAAQIRSLHGNLLRNASAEEQNLSSWTVTANGGSGWLAGTTGVGDQTCFQTSFDWDRKEQLIDLLADGYAAANLDAAPNICYGESVFRRFDVTGVWRHMTVTLLNGSMTPITSFSTGDVNDTSIPAAGSIHLSGTFSGYGPGLRYIRFEHGGRDLPSWGGHFGAYLFGSFVYFCEE